eukprot:TRINITY_DN23521_c0_g1_i1.p2 TRINITY_DN23521_c0_g1~~TRINITY_DN23521_c0_g1_i1.p2  ORF type:complete len:245 (+),score=94.78 TRINITY_DN23521_c0_g1_i1:431-1165(+)
MSAMSLSPAAASSPAAVSLNHASADAAHHVPRESAVLGVVSSGSNSATVLDGSRVVVQPRLDDLVQSRQQPAATVAADASAAVLPVERLCSAADVDVVGHCPPLLPLNHHHLDADQQQQQQICLVSDEEFEQLLGQPTTPAAEETLLGLVGHGQPDAAVLDGEPAAGVAEAAPQLQLDLDARNLTEDVERMGGDDDEYVFDLLDKEPLFEDSKDLLDTPDTERLLDDLWLEAKCNGVSADTWLF